MIQLNILTYSSQNFWFIVTFLIAFSITHGLIVFSTHQSLSSLNKNSQIDSKKNVKLSFIQKFIIISLMFFNSPLEHFNIYHLINLNLGLEDLQCCAFFSVSRNFPVKKKNKKKDSSIWFQERPTILSDSFYDRLEEILFSYKEFNKSNLKVREKKQNKIDQSFVPENSVSTFLKGDCVSKWTENILSLHFNQFFSQILSTCEGTRFSKKTFPKIMFEAISLIKKLFVLKVGKEQSKQILHSLKFKEFILILKQKNVIKLLFTQISQHVVSKYYRDLFIHEKNDLSNSVLLYTISQILRDFLFSLLLNHYSCIEDLESKIKYNKLISIDSLELESEESQIESELRSLLMTLSHQIVSFLEESNFIRSPKITTKRTKSGTKSTKTYKLTNKLKGHEIINFLLPRIVEPKSDLQVKVKPVFNGVGKCFLSDLAKESIQISNSKKHRINPIAIEVLESIYDGEILKHKDIRIKVPTPWGLTEFQGELKNLSASYWNEKTTSFHEKLRLLRSEKSFNYKLAVKKLNSELGLNPMRLITYKRLEDLQHKIYSLENNLKVFNTQIRIAKILIGFPLYFTNFLDYRGRMYPESYLFSRTSGFYKYLVTDFKAVQFSKGNWNTFISHYYSPDITLLTKWKSFHLSLKNIKLSDYVIETRSFVQSHELDYTGIKNKIYFKIFFLEILNSLKTGKVNFCIEIDQNASSAILSSILLKDRGLAKACNLFQSKSKRNITTLLSASTGSFLRENNLNSGIEIYFESIRDLHKYALMKTFYNQTHHGRVEDWKNTLDQLGINLTLEQKRDLYKFSYLYPKFLSSLFLGFSEQISLINSSFLEVSKFKTLTKVTNVDGSIFCWDFYKTKTIGKKTWLESLQSFKTLWVSKPTSTWDKDRASRAFYPGLIHGMDAAIVRLVVFRVFNASLGKANLTHLHDCFSVSAKHLPILLKELARVYNEDLRFAKGKHKEDLFDLMYLSSSMKSLPKPQENKVLQLKKKLNKKKPLNVFISQKNSISKLYSHED